MPQVASPSSKVHAHNHAQTRTAHTASADRGGTPSLFDSLVDQSATNPRQAQTDTQGGAQPAGQKPPVGQSSKADAAKGEPPAQSESPASTVAVTDIKAAEDAAPTQTILLAGPDAAKADAPKDEAPAKDPAKDAAEPLPPVAVDPALVADPAAAAAAAAVTPPVAPATEQPSPTGEDTTAAAPAGATVTTTVPTVPAQPDPVEPAFVAAATAQKLQPFDGKDTGKGKTQADKPMAASAKTATSAPSAPQAVPDEDQAVPPQPQAGSTQAAADSKPAPDKTAAKDTHHDRIDATATAKLDTPAPAIADGSAVAGTQGAPAATGTVSAHSASAASANAAAQTAANVPQAPTVPMGGLAVEIAGRAHAGKNNFEIRLDPPELGRIEVKLSVDRQGQVTSHLIADRADTLDLLRRDSASLERALQDAGLKTGGDGLQFSLRDQSFNGGQNGDGRSNASQVLATDDTLPAIDAAAGGYTRFSGRIGGIDIRV